MHLAYGYRTAGRRGLGPLHSEHRQAPWLQVIEKPPGWPRRRRDALIGIVDEAELS